MKFKFDHLLNSILSNFSKHVTIVILIFSERIYTLRGFLSDSRDVFLSVCVWCVILGAKRKVMLWSKKSRERRESSKIGHTGLSKNTCAEVENTQCNIYFD